MSSSPPSIPALRFGKSYDSLDANEVKNHRSGEVMAHVSQVNAGIIRRDMRRLDKLTEPFRQLSIPKLVELCNKAGEIFLHDTLPLNEEGATQSVDEYVETLSATSGMPHKLCRKNMQKVYTVFRDMDTILRGLTRGIDLEVLEEGMGYQGDVPVSYAPMARALGVILPSNSPGVNSIWMPAIALKIPVLLKPGREEPWTPLRIIQAFIAAGVPREAFGFYPTDHEGSAAILDTCERSQLFGDERVTSAYAHNPNIEIHGPGRSKVIIGDDVIDDWESFIDVLVGSVADNGGRSCINASTILVSRHADEIAEAVAEKLAKIEPKPAQDPEAKLSAFANPKFAEFIDQAVEKGLTESTARDVTASYREGTRHQVLEGSQYLRPTLVRCDTLSHPLGNTEFLFPFASVVEMEQDRFLEEMGPSLVVSAITKDPQFRDDLLKCGHIERLNLGPVPTSRVDWDQPHEGNLFEFLYSRRAIHRAEEW